MNPAATPFEAALAAHVSRLQAAAPEGATLSVEPGRRYLRIVRTDRGGSRSVVQFIDGMNGDVLKAASWKAPAKGVRGSIYPLASEVALP